VSVAWQSLSVSTAALELGVAIAQPAPLRRTKLACVEL
jgi:hypothetical protein